LQKQQVLEHLPKTELPTNIAKHVSFERLVNNADIAMYRAKKQ
jgi:hypothetical protein